MQVQIARGHAKETTWDRGSASPEVPQLRFLWRPEESIVVEAALAYGDDLPWSQSRSKKTTARDPA